MSLSPDPLGGRYVLDERIGAGGVADVYRAHDLVLDRDVAVKVLRVGDAGAPGSPEDTAARAERARFVGEVQLLAGLVHPGLVTLLDADTRGEQAFLVMDLVDGPTLRAVLDDGPLPSGSAGEIGAQLAAALAWAHARGVVHRDVKPANVLLDDSGRARLADFGIARLVDDTRHHTRTGFAIGTAAYLAPEQVRGEPVTGAADVYALGLVLIEAITGEHPFPGTATETVHARLHRDPVLPADLSPTWRSLLAAMTAAEPRLRPSAAEVAAELGLGDTGPVVAPVETTARDGARRRGVLVGAGAAVAACVVALTVLSAGGTNGVQPGRGSTPAPVATGSATPPAAPIGSTGQDRVVAEPSPEPATEPATVPATVSSSAPVDRTPPTPRKAAEQREDRVEQAERGRERERQRETRRTDEAAESAEKAAEKAAAEAARAAQREARAAEKRAREADKADQAAEKAAEKADKAEEKPAGPKGPGGPKG